MHGSLWRAARVSGIIESIGLSGVNRDWIRCLPSVGACLVCLSKIPFQDSGGPERHRLFRFLALRAMNHAFDEFRLEDIADRHRVNTTLFVPLVVERLRPRAGVTECLLTVELRGFEGFPQKRTLQLHWSQASSLAKPPGLQENTLTEWAALGIASVMLPLYASLSIRSVAVPGNSFDYWVTDGRWQYGLEVSGTMNEDVEPRHREKVRQLRTNPYGVDGFVVTVGFPTREVIFSFHTYAEDTA